MRKEEMFAIAKKELAHIPKGDYPQGVLRSSYWMMRLNSLGRKPEFPNDPAQIIRRAADDVHRLVPSASLTYDSEYFA